jgi:hypothetical protein
MNHQTCVAAVVSQDMWVVRLILLKFIATFAHISRGLAPGKHLRQIAAKSSCSMRALAYLAALLGVPAADLGGPVVGGGVEVAVLPDTVPALQPAHHTCGKVSGPSLVILALTHKI